MGIAKKHDIPIVLPMEFPGEDNGFYFPNMLSNSYYPWHDHDMMATLLYQEDKPFQATGSDVHDWEMHIPDHINPMRTSIIMQYMEV